MSGTSLETTFTSADNVLFIPGPVSLDSARLAVMHESPHLHYGKAWADLYHNTLEQVKTICGFSSAFGVLLPGTGTLGLETALFNIMTLGDRVLVLSNGFFGSRLGVQAQRLGADVSVLQFPWSVPIDTEQVAEHMRTNGPFKAMVFVHHETSSGICNPLRELAELGRSSNMLVVVDAISSAGGIPIRCDEWGVDVLVSVSNKCLEGVPGVAPILISPYAWQVIEEQPPRAWYLDLRVWKQCDKESHDFFPHPSTMPTNAIRVLNTSVGLIIQNGEAHYQRYLDAAACVRHTLRSLNQTSLIDEHFLGPLLTPLQVVSSTEAARVTKALEADGVIIARGLGDFSDKSVRIATMGAAAEPAMLARLVQSLNKYFDQH